jgi:signal transduction histidine kinase/CheY-like chemotaxis protein
VTKDTQMQAMVSAMRIAAGLLIVYSAISVVVDWNALVVREKLTHASAFDVLLSFGAASQEKYQRLYTLAAYALTSLATAVVLVIVPLLSTRGEDTGGSRWLSLGAFAFALALLTISAHVPFVLPHTVAFTTDNLLSTQTAYSRAFRDAITYVWSSALLLVIPVVGSVKIDTRVKFISAGLALVAVGSAYLPHKDHEGGRTDNELIIFTFAIASLLYLIGRIQQAITGERQARESAEAALQTARTERLRYEEQSEAAIGEFRAIQQRLEVREERRTAFLAAAAHDLKQPLLSSMLYGDLLVQAIKDGAGQPTSPGAARYADILKAEIKSLASAFDAILDYSQIESGRILAKVGEHRLADILSELERRFAPQAAERDLTIRFLPPQGECIVQTDRELVIRVLSNVISNAVKFTATHRRHRPRRARHDISVRTRVRGLLVTVYVMDQGCGIPIDMQEAIFEAGVQVANSHRERHEGFGLGLATVKGIVSRALRDHSIRLKSIENRGTHVMVDVPIAFVEFEDPPSVDGADLGSGPVHLAGAMIAVVEDDALQRAALVDILRLAGAFVKAAGSLSGLHSQLDETVRYPDVILTDYRLPEGATGATVITAVRQRCNGRDIPALILTADDIAAADATRELPATEVIRKPIDRKTLLHCVSARCDATLSPLDSATGDQSSSRSTTPARAIS